MTGSAIDAVGVFYALRAHQFLLLQLAGFVMNMDTRQQVQKLQHEVMQCTHELSSLQDHLKNGLAEVKERIDDSQDRCNAFQGAAKVLRVACLQLQLHLWAVFVAAAMLCVTSDAQPCVNLPLCCSHLLVSLHACARLLCFA